MRKPQRPTASGNSIGKLQLVLLLLSMLLPASFAAAQQVQKFTGRVTDPSGAVVPNAAVVVHSIDSGVDTTTKTTSSGDYTVPYLLPGNYSISVKAPGFETEAHSGLILQVDQAATVNFTLKIGSEAITVTVNSDSFLDSAKADNGEVVENTRVTELPLNGRDPGMLAMLAPGTLYVNNVQYQRPFDNTQQYMSVNGGGTGGVALMMDGVSNSTSPINNNGSAEAAFVPPVDAVQEFKIVTNPFDAQYGLMAGAVEDVTLKTGTSRLHGDVYEYARRQWMDANTWQNNWFIKTAKPGTNLAPFATPQMKWDQYGAELDGPVELPKFHHGKPQTFFTAQYENFREVQPNTLTDSVPSPQWLNGDFSNDVYWNGTAYAPITIYDPLSIKQNAGGQWVRQPFGPTDPISPGPANVIPASRINPVAQALLKLYPAPNTTPPVGANPFANNYVVSAYDVSRYRNVLGKLDHNFGERDRASLSYGYWERVELRNGNGLLGPAQTGWAPLGERNNTFTLKETHTFTPQLLLDVRANVGVRSDFTFYGAPFNPTNIFNWSPALVSSLGPAAVTEFPALTLTNYTSMGTNSNNQIVKNSLNVFPTITWIKRSQSIHAGLDLRFWQTDTNIVGGGASFTTDNTWTQIQCGSCGGNSTYQSSGNAIASFLLGVPTSGSNTISSKTFWTAHYYAPFVQDDWKLNSKLTLNLGVRWDFLPGEVERHNKGNYTFDTTDPNPIGSQVSVPGYGQLLGGIRFLGVNGNPRQAYGLTKTNIQPRVGFAYAYNDKTVLRGGFGESMKSPQNAPITAGFTASTSYLANDPNYPGSVYPNMATPINNPFASVVQPTGSSLGMLTQLGQGPASLNSNYRTPQFWNYSLGVERQLSGHDLINISYVGTRLYHGDSSDNINHENAATIMARNCNPDTGGIWENCNNYNVTNPFRGVAGFQGSTYYSASTINGLNLTRPFPEFTDITQNQLNDYRTWYNSLQVVGDHRMSKGFVLHGTWTYSHLMDAGGWRDTTFRVPLRRLDSNDHTHVITISGVYNLPIGRGHALMPNMNRILDTAIGGWEVGSLFTLQSGAPWVLSNKYMLHSPYVHPHIQADNGYIRMIAPCVEQWVDSTNSQGQPAYTLQQLSYDSDTACPNGADMENVGSFMPVPNNVYQGVRLLRTDDIDVNLSKNFALVDAFHLQVRLEAFNVPNHPLWTQSPDGTIQDSAFGEIQRGPSGQANQPRILQISGKLVW